MKLVLLFGPHAVGKMTVGQELAKLTELKLFYNHMTIDLVGQFFNYSTKEGKELVKTFRQEIFEAVSKSDLDGLIFTFVWLFDVERDWEYVRDLAQLFESRGAEVCYVELEADLEERLKRNVTPNRLEHKPSKRDLEWSRKDVVTGSQKYRLNSHPGEIPYVNYLRINTMELSPKEAAQKIKETFRLESKSLQPDWS